jgi:hypothetical protein
VALGGGYSISITGLPVGGGEVTNIISAPTLSGTEATGWTVTAYEDNDGDVGNWSVTAYAICVTDPTP